MKNKRTIAVRVSEDQLKTIRDIANREKRSVSAVIRNLIDEEKDRQVRKA